MSVAVYFLGRSRRRHVALDPTRKIALPLIEKEELSHDTRRFRFGLPNEDDVLGLPVGQHVSLSYTSAEGKLVARSYTPTSSDDDVGFIDFVVKVYFANVHPKFPDGGKMSQHLESLAIGDTIDVRGPKGKLEYLGRGNFAIAPRPSAAPVAKSYARIGMVAGGTGITPMLQIIRAMMKDPADNTEVWLLYANQTEDDILLRQELEDVRDASGGRFHLWYTLDRPRDDWEYSTGFVTEDMLRTHMPAPGNDALITFCGPPPMLKFCLEPHLPTIGHDMKNNFFAF